MYGILWDERAIGRLAMSKNSRLLLIFLSAFTAQALMNLWWIYRPSVFNSICLVGGNMLFGIIWIGCLCVGAARSIRARR